MATNNSANINQQGVVYYDGISTFSGKDAGNIGYVLTSNGTGAAPTFQAFSVSPIPWTSEATSFSAAVTNGYIATAALTMTLPLAPANGSIISLIVDTTGSVIIQANTLQFIRIGGSISSAAGTATSTARGNTVTLIYNSSDLTWLAESFITNWTLA